MTPDLPTPDQLRDARRRQQVRDLLDGQRFLPQLATRLSAGFFTLDDATAGRWAGWIKALRHDPGWPILEPALGSSHAWPDVWHRARAAGFSPTTDHFNALFFTGLFHRALAVKRLELARRSWREALVSWAALAQGTYLTHTFPADLREELTADQLHTVLASLLQGPLARLEQLAIESLRLPQWQDPPSRRPLLFVRGCLEQGHQIFSEARQQWPQSPLITGTLESLAAVPQAIQRQLVQRFQHQLSQLDLACAERSSLLAIFDGALSRCERLGFPPPLDRALLRQGLSLIWDLRELQRDDQLGIIPPMIERLEPCAKRLRQEDGDYFFGLEGAVADLLVFKGEEAVRLDTRQAAFEEALEICPGHRNASRLLSYLLLERANRQLLKTSALPDATSALGAARRRLRPLFERAAKAIERAERLYPDNDLVHRYRADLEAELQRFQLTVEDFHDH